MNFIKQISSKSKKITTYQPPNRMLNMSFTDVKKFVKNKKSLIIGEKITDILLCGAMLYNYEGLKDSKFNSLMDWEGPLILKTTSHQLEFDSAANYFAVGIDAINIDKVIEIENISLEELDQIKDIFNIKEYWDISYMFSNNVIGKIITNIESIEDECEGPGVVVTLEDSIKIKIINDMDWISMVVK